MSANRGTLRAIVNFRHDLWKRQGGCCLLCGHVIECDPTAIDPWKRLSLEHVIPRGLGGSNGVKNLAVSHRICNKNRGVDPLTKEQVARMVRWYGREGGERVKQVADLPPFDCTAVEER